MSAVFFGRRKRNAALRLYMPGGGNTMGQEQKQDNLIFDGGVDRKRLAHFQAEVYGVKEEPVEDFTEMLSRKNIRTIRSVAVFIILSIVVIVLCDSLEGIVYAKTAYVLLLLLWISSFHMILAPIRIKKTSGKRIRFATLIYYLLVIITATAWIIFRNMHPTFQEVPNSVIGMPIISIMMCLLVFAPIPFATDNIILLAVLLVTTFVPLIPAFDGANYCLRDQIILRIGLVMAYWCVGDANMRLMHNADTVRELNWQTLNAYFIDKTTGLLNRNAMMTYWNYLRQITPKSVAIIRCDVDNFRKYNDAQGHQKGDAALHDIGAAMKKVVLEEGRYLFRTEGDEFAVLIPNAEIDQVWNIAERMRQEVYDASIMLTTDSDVTRLTVTIGCAIEPVALSHNDDFLQRAEREMTEGKKKKNVVAFVHEVRG